MSAEIQATSSEPESSRYKARGKDETGSQIIEASPGRQDAVPIVSTRPLDRDTFTFVNVFSLAFSCINSHGEVFAVSPTAGGQYHRAAMPSPPRWRASISWITGMLNGICLWLGLAAASYLQYGRLNDPGEQPRLRHHSGGANSMFAGTNNATGWDSMVIAWLIGLLQLSYAFIGFDIVYHVSKELSNPKKEGPRAANWTILFSGMSAWFVIVCNLFCISDIDRVTGTDLGLPFVQICMDATGSRAATTIFILIVLLVFCNATRGNTISASRTLLAFGRDGMLPYGHLFTVVKLGGPVWGIALSVTVALLAGLFQFGPAAAFSSLLGAATIFFFLSYTASSFGGRAKLNKRFPNRLHNLGRWGVLCNIVAIFFVVQSLIIYSFPSVMPVAADNMNYVIVFAAFFFALLVIVYSYAKQRYEGPQVYFLNEMVYDEVIEATELEPNQHMSL